MQYFLFTVNEKSWKEHIATGIAAINNPGHDLTNRQGNAKKQIALCELAGIKIGDLFYFYMQQEKQILGLYEATSMPFFDTASLVKGGFIDRKFPIRVAFRQVVNFPIPLAMDEVWKEKDRGKFWSIQQQRGDTVGRHACCTITREDGDHLHRMFQEKNPVILPAHKKRSQRHSSRPLPLDFESVAGKIHYEAVLQATLLRDLKLGKHKKVFGDFDYFVPFFPTSSQKEIDILLLKHDGTGVVWYEILELKSSTFDKDELDKVMNYESWVTGSLAHNSRMVHSIGIAHEFDAETKKYIIDREVFTGKKIRLIRYIFNRRSKTLSFQEEA